MRHGRWVGRAGSFAVSLALAVLVTASLVAAIETLVAAQLATRAMQREAVDRVSASALGVGAGSQSRLPNSSDLATFARAGDVREVLLVGADGQVRASAAGAASASSAPSPPAPGTEVDAATHTVVERVARTGEPDVTQVKAQGGDTLAVTVPVPASRGATVVRVVLNDHAGARRAQELRRGLTLVLWLGALATVPLVLVLGGRHLARRHARAVHEAATDDLTGLRNRRAFGDDLRDEVARAQQAGMPLTLAALDVNGLETIHEVVGRRRGDVLLTSIGATLAGVDATQGARAYRIGGDAFAVVLPGASQEQAFGVADDLRRRIVAAAGPLTVNVGLSQLDDERCVDAETLLIAADAALHEARRMGGNRVVASGDGVTGLRWVATSQAHDRLTRP